MSSRWIRRGKGFGIAGLYMNCGMFTRMLRRISFRIIEQAGARQSMKSGEIFFEIR